MPIVRAVLAETQMLDLPTTFHSFLNDCEAKHGSLRQFTVSLFRKTEHDNGPIGMKVTRLSEGDVPALLLDGLDDMLDAMLAKNLQWWFDSDQFAKVAATKPRLLRDRHLA